MLAYLVLSVLVLLSRTVMADWPDEMNTDFLAWRWQTCLVVGEWLYIDGGEFYTGNGSIADALDVTLAFDLSNSWSIDSVSPLYTEKPSSMELVRRPLMWYNPKADTVFSGGGWGYFSSEGYSLYEFQPNGQGGVNWHIASDTAQDYSPTFASALAASNGAFYSLAGTESTDFTTAVGGLAIFDFGADSWNTVSTAAASQSGYTVFAEAAFLPNFGEQGLLVSLGGDSPPNSTFEYEAGAALVDMSVITIYDPKTQAWFHQTATGDIPPPRSEFCAVGNAAADNATFEMYIYGGSDVPTNDTASLSEEGYTDVYVLSFPSFTWFKTGAAPPGLRRATHTCQLIGNSQMLVVGGGEPGTFEALGGWGGGPDPWNRGMLIFDMVKWTWTTAYNHAAVYTRPKIIAQHYATSSNNTKWSDPKLADLFVAKSPSSESSSATTTSSGGSNPTSSSSAGGSSSSTPGSSSSSSSPAPAKSSNHAGAIAGGVVGGLAGLALVAGAILFATTRRSRKHHATAAGATAAGAGGSDSSGDKARHHAEKDSAGVYEAAPPRTAAADPAPVYEIRDRNSLTDAELDAEAGADKEHEVVPVVMVHELAHERGSEAEGRAAELP